MKLTPAAATSTCTSPSTGSGRSWSRTCRTLRSPGSETKTLVARFMVDTLRPALRAPAPASARWGSGRPDAHEQGDLLLEGDEQLLRVGHDRLVGHDPDSHGPVVRDDAEAEGLPARTGHPAEEPGHGDPGERARLARARDVGGHADRLVREEVHEP